MIGLFGFVTAQVGEPPAQLVTALSELNPTRTAQGYRLGGVQFSNELRNGALYSVSGNAVLNPRGQGALAQLIGAATGYDDRIAEPLAEFLGGGVAELVGQGEIPLAVEEFVPDARRDRRRGPVPDTFWARATRSPG